MEAVLLYLGKMLICSAVMLGYYQLFLKDKTFHHYNRFYLVATLVISIFLPLLKVEHLTIETDSRLILLLSDLRMNTTEISSAGENWLFLWIVALGISIFFLGRLLLGIIKIRQLQNKYPAEQLEGIRFYRTDLHEAPFSFFRNLFWKNALEINSETGRQILKHEMVHIEQGHSFDKMLSETAKALCWFNPFFYLINKELNLIHEYLADKKAIKQSDTKAFAQMLLVNSFAGKPLPATSPFLNSNLKKRLTMLKKSKTKFAYMRKLFALPLLFLLTFTYLVTAKNKEITAANHAIAQAVETLQNDTVKSVPPPPPSPQAPVVVKTIKTEIKKPVDSKKIAVLANDLKKKTRELKRLKPQTEKFDAKVKEINSISRQIELNSGAPRIIRMQDGIPMVLNFDGADFNFDFKQMQKNAELLAKQFNSEEFKNKMKENEAYFKSKEFKDQLKNVRQFRVQSRFDNIEELQENARKLADSARMNASKYRGKAELAAKKAELAKEHAELAKKQAELMKKEIELYGHIKQEPFVIVNGRMAKLPPKLQILIDGKPATEAQMNALKPEEIERMDVNKTKVDGVEKNEIKITTRKK